MIKPEAHFIPYSHGPSEVMSSSPPGFGAPVPLPHGPGSSSPLGLTGELDEDPRSESGESKYANRVLNYLFTPVSPTKR